VGLAPPHTVLAAFRLAQLWPDLSSPVLTMPLLADHGGYSSDRTLRAHCEKVLRWNPSHIRRFRSDADLLVGLTLALSNTSDGKTQARKDHDYGMLMLADHSPAR
jgi:hypothetical protein